MEPHPGALEAHPGALGADPGSMEAYYKTQKIYQSPLYALCGRTVRRFYHVKSNLSQPKKNNDLQ